MTSSDEVWEMLAKMKKFEQDWSQRRLGEEYGEKMSEEVFQALMRQMRRDGRIQNGEIGAVVPTDEAGLKWDWEDLGSQEKEVYDDPEFKRQISDAVSSVRCGSPWRFENRMSYLVQDLSKNLHWALTALEDNESWAVKTQFKSN